MAAMDSDHRPRLRHEADRNIQPPRPVGRTVIGWLSSPDMRYQNAYLWFILFSAMDVMLTWKILARGGIELNPVARMVIDDWGLWGAIAFKFCLMLFVIVICEVVGRRRERTGRWLARIAVGISACPVAYSLWLLVYHILIVPARG